MHRYQAAPAQRTSGSARDRTDAHAALRSDAGAAPLDRNAKATSLLQLRNTLDRSPGVQAQLALQRALDRSAGLGTAPQKRREKPPLQKKQTAIADSPGVIGVMQRKYKVPSKLRFSELGIGRSQGAGITDEKVEMTGGLQVTQHFHCNKWDEKALEFESFTGTFLIDHKDPKYHYTIPEHDMTGAWQGAKPDKGEFGMKFRTQLKFQDLIKQEVVAKPAAKPAAKQADSKGGAGASSSAKGEDVKKNKGDDVKKK
jgi:hypothetical protein